MRAGFEYCKLRSSELVPHPQIDNSLDAEACLETAEPMFCTGFQPEGGQLERRKHSVMVDSYRLDETIIISVFSSMFDIQTHGKPRVKGQMRAVEVGESQRGHYQEMMLLILPRGIFWHSNIPDIAFLFIKIITCRKA